MSFQQDRAEDFEPLRFLGKGAFGAVVLVRRRGGCAPGRRYAMKVLLKRKHGEVGLVMFQDNDACCRICRSGKNPNMRHIQRTHRIDVAPSWREEQDVLWHRFSQISSFHAARCVTFHTAA